MEEPFYYAGCNQTVLPTWSYSQQAFPIDLFANSAFLDFQDALAVAHMEEANISEILSYDRDFDRIAGIQRVEP